MLTRLKVLLRRTRSAPLVVVAGLVGALAMSLATANPLSAFIAAIAPVGETVAATPVVLEETGGGGALTCSSDDRAPDARAASSTCTTIDTYGGATAMVPSDASGATSTSVTFRNTGAATATSFTLAFGACTQSSGDTPSGSATDHCGKLHVEVVSGPTVVVADTPAAALAGARFNVPIPAAGGASTVPVTVTTYLDSSADNTHQGLSASQPVTWTLSA